MACGIQFSTQYLERALSGLCAFMFVLPDVCSGVRKLVCSPLLFNDGFSPHLSRPTSSAVGLDTAPVRVSATELKSLIVSGPPRRILKGSSGMGRDGAG